VPLVRRRFGADTRVHIPQGARIASAYLESGEKGLANGLGG
jgi:hypothetical protein